MKKVDKYLIALIMWGLLIISFNKCSAQSFKEYIPTGSCIFGLGLSDGLRDAAMYRMDGYSNWMNGKVSWLNKYKNHDPKQGAAFIGSTSVFVGFTDLAHLSNLVSHQFEGLGALLAPEDNNKRFGHLMLKLVAYNIIRSAGHYITYDLIYKPQGRD